MAKKEYIYVSAEELDKNNLQPVSEDQIKNTEDDAISTIIAGGLGEEKQSMFDKGKKIDLYLYKINSELLPIIYKSVKIKKDGESYIYADGKDYPLPDDFTGYKKYGKKKDAESNTEVPEDQNAEDTGDDYTSTEVPAEQNADDAATENPPVDNQGTGDNADSGDEYTTSEVPAEQNTQEEQPAENQPVENPPAEDQSTEDTGDEYTSTEVPADQQQNNTETKQENAMDTYLDNLGSMIIGNRLRDMYESGVVSEDRFNTINSVIGINETVETPTDPPIPEKPESPKPSKPEPILPPEKPVTTPADTAKTESAMHNIFSKSLSNLSTLVENGTITKESANLMIADISAAIMIEKSGLYTEENLDDSIIKVYENANNWLKTIEVTNPLINRAKYVCEAYMEEKVLKAKDRNALDDSDFGIPSEKKYPMPDKRHVSAAIQRFNHVDPKHEKELARNIIKKLKKYDMLDDIEVSENNRFHKYIKESYDLFKESYNIYPLVGSNSPVAKEFTIGAMLPMMGSTSGWGTKLANDSIEDVVKATNSEIEKYAKLYDTTSMYRDAIFTRDRLASDGFSDFDRMNSSEQVTYESNDEPKTSLIFESEVKKLVNKLGACVKNKDIESAQNFRRNVFTFDLDMTDDDECKNKLFSSIKSCGFSAVDDNPASGVFEKDVKNYIILITYGDYSKQLTISYDLKDSFSVITEASKDEIDSDIKPIIDKLNRLRYKTKYSCSGHIGSRTKNDVYRDGIKNNKLYTTARIVFDKDYEIGAPEGWHIKDFEDGFGIYPREISYNAKNGIPDDAFNKWKSDYMSKLKTWVDNIGEKPGPDKE